MKKPTAVETALDIAYEAHKGARTFSGKPYILHPIRVMEQMDTDEERVIALLHDVLEDTETTEEELREHFSTRIVGQIKVLTHLPDEPYEDYIGRVALYATSTKIKLADLRDNTRIERIPRMTDGALKRLQRYHGAIRRLERQE
ncbi:hypothetical protein LCGC14_0823510 [marine sediment metagenome]|uniref:HD domain-containing protein n=1 Tax=marine sediment metagenome TaxID=412755 RepID=A0A0F9SQM8_9ZZZZ